MRIFISYPREFENSAKTIYWELLSLGFADVFLDSETLHVGDNWKKVIKTKIREADVLIILYDHGAASDMSRYFYTELEHRIKEECKNNGKLIITVLFPPATLKKNNLPIYLKDRQVIASTTEGIDHPSIDRVIQRVQGLEDKRREAEGREEGRKYTLVVSLLMAAILILTGIFMFKQSKPLPDSTTVAGSQESGTEEKPDPWAASKKTCEDLKGIYNLLGEYVYIDERNLKATAVNGRWEAAICKRIAEPIGTYTLEGKEETTHLVRITINSTYKQVKAINQSRSVITINEDGRLTDRRIFFSVDGKPKGDPEIVERDSIGTLSKREVNDVTAKLNRYKLLVREKHENAEKHMHCIPARGKNKDNQEVIASICRHDPISPNSPYYIRAMVQHHFIGEGN